MARVTPAALVLMLAACEAQDERARWLQDTLVADNEVFLRSDPEQAHAKFARMSMSQYAFFRGTMPQFARDLNAGLGRSRYATAETADVASIGDPHPENIGSFRGADGALVIDYNDFDAANYGPFHFDVRRLALGFHVAAQELGLDAPEVAAEAAVAGYVAEIAGLAGDTVALTAVGSHGQILDDTLRKAERDGAAREELDDYTRVEGGRRVMYFGEVEPPVPWRRGGYAIDVARDSVEPLDADETRAIARVIAAWPKSLVGPARMGPQERAIKGASRRLGAGVASFAAPRFYVLLEGPSAALSDDVLLEVKQVYDPPLAPGRSFADNGARVVELQRAVQTTTTDDPLLGHASDGAASYRIRDRSKFQRGVDLVKIARQMKDGEFVAEDLVVLADRAGHLLARGHARAARACGEPGRPGRAAALGDDADGFVAETLEFVDEYVPVLAADYQSFLDALASDGPSLGG